MTQKQITHLQDMIDDFFSETQTEARIDSEGYPHSPYVSQLGKSQEEFVHFIDEVNEHLGNQVELAPLLFNTLSFKQCMHDLSNNIRTPVVMLQLVETKEVTDSNNNKLNYSIWQHDSGRFIQLLQQNLNSMNDDRDYYLKTLSCNEVTKKYDNQFKEYYFTQKEKL